MRSLTRKMQPKEQALFRAYARYYEPIYSGEYTNYEKDARKLTKFINAHKRSTGNDLLEVACGTGLFLEHLRTDFNCTGTDISSSMLAIARKKKLGVQLRREDMSNMSTKRKYDAVLCLGACGYFGNDQNLARILNNFSTSLKSGGIVIIDQHFTVGEINGNTITTRPLHQDGVPYVTVHGNENLKITKVSYPQIVGNKEKLYFFITAAERGKMPVVFVDERDIHLYDIAKVLKMMEELGLEASYDPKLIAKGAWIGVKKG